MRGNTGAAGQLGRLFCWRQTGFGKEAKITRELLCFSGALSAGQGRIRWQIGPFIYKKADL